MATAKIPSSLPLRIALVVALFAGGFTFYRWRHPHAPTIAAPSDVAAAPAGALHTASGIAYVVLRPGTGGRHPRATDTVSVHYTGWTTNGEMFDSSVTRGEPAEFPLDHVIAGWTEGVQLMTEGEQVRFWIPGRLAYDGNDSPDVPHGTLVFDIELLRIL